MLEVSKINIKINDNKDIKENDENDNDDSYEEYIYAHNSLNKNILSWIKIYLKKIILIIKKI